jgi:threonine dehydrogenase-like Zn-dependent dehydrogenase
VVSGAGAIGLMTVQLLVMSGARVLVVEPNAGRREQALEAGAFDTLDPIEAGEFVGYEVKRRLGGTGADIAVETSGNYAGLNGMIASVRYAGTVVAVGFYQGGGSALRLGEEWHHNRITMKSSMGVWDNPHRDYPSWDRPRVMRTVVDLLYSGRLRTDFMPVEHHPFDDAPAVYRELAAAPSDHLKIAFDYS